MPPESAAYERLDRCRLPTGDLREERRQTVCRDVCVKQGLQGWRASLDLLEVPARVLLVVPTVAGADDRQFFAMERRREGQRLVVAVRQRTDPSVGGSSLLQEG